MSDAIDQAASRALDEALDEGPGAQPPPPDNRNRRIIAVLITLLLAPGIGHFALGHWRRGLWWFAAAWPLLLVFVVAPETHYVVACILLIAGLKLGPSVDVIRVPVPDRAPRTSIARRLPAAGTVVMAATAMVGVSALLSVMVRAYVVEAFRVPSGSMTPTLAIGDHIFVEKLSYRFGEPERGDVAVFVHPCQPHKDFIKRVVAVGGDTVEMRCDALYINGEQVWHELLAGPDSCAYWDVEWPDGWVKEPCSLYRHTIGEVSFDAISRPDRPRRSESRSLEPASPTGNFPRKYRGEPELPTCDRDPTSVVREEAAAGTFEDSLPERDTYRELDECAPSVRYRVPDRHVFVIGDNRDNSSDSRVWGAVPVDHLEGRAIRVWWSSRSAEAGGIQWGRIGAWIR